jgi:rhodanese-related sulfurtransferase
VRGDEVPTVTLADLRAGVLLLDVREDDEWDAGHAPDAVHLPMGEVVARLAEIPRDADVVVVCRSGQRSAAVTGYLVQGGWNARNLAGGMIAWHAAARPLTSAAATPPTIL